MDFLYTLLKFLIAGFVVVGVTTIVQQMDPRYGGILAAAPITTTLAFLFTYHEAGGETTRQLVFGSFLFAIPTVLFIIALFVLMNRYQFFPSLGGAYLVWLSGIILIQRVVPG